MATYVFKFYISANNFVPEVTGPVSGKLTLSYQVEPLPKYLVIRNLHSYLGGRVKVLNCSVGSVMIRGSLCIAMSQLQSSHSNPPLRKKAKIAKGKIVISKTISSPVVPWEVLWMDDSRGSLDETPWNTEGIMGSITFETTGDVTDEAVWVYRIQQCFLTTVNHLFYWI